MPPYLLTPAQTGVGAVDLSKRYRRPVLETREPIEALAALCSPISGGKAEQSLCNPIRS